MNKIKSKCIGIDARFYGPIGKGLGRYTQEIVDNIIKIDKDNEYIIFLRKENFDEFLPPIGLGARVKKVIADVKWYTLAEQILMPYVIWREHVDLMHFPHFNVPVLCPAKFVVTIHDLILTKFPTARATTLGPILYKAKNFVYKIIIWLVVKRAKKIIAVSEFTKNDMVKQFSVKPEKVVVTYEGVANLAKGRDSLFVAKLDDKKTLSAYNINNPFLLYVGNAYPHKNLEALVRVFGKMANRHSEPALRAKNPVENEQRLSTGSFAIAQDDDNKLSLVLVGKEDYFYKRIKDYAASLGLWREGDALSPIIFPGYAPDAELEILFQKALAYVFPSLYEGFGLPPLEAMAKGCPVISSNKASMPEILGGAAIYFNPEDEEEMEKKIMKVVIDENLRQDLRKRGFEQVKKYSWWECARKTLEVYEEVLR
ncbi:glycosyltransferase family 4 protein [Candidatus Falkowbacteria bacterium]|nr:glycosyltransferase family 4 protein [Candidatus Falkowbacteria bacterium]